MFVQWERAMLFSRKQVSRVCGSRYHAQRACFPHLDWLAHGDPWSRHPLSSQPVDGLVGVDARAVGGGQRVTAGRDGARTLGVVSESDLRQPSKQERHSGTRCYPGTGDRVAYTGPDFCHVADGDCVGF